MQHLSSKSERISPEELAKAIAEEEDEF